MLWLRLGTGRGDLRERDHLEVLDVDGSITLKLILKKRNAKFDLVQNRDR